MTQRCGFIAVCGAPNVGKSTLVNALVGSKVSIVSRKAQTTRAPVLGIMLQQHSQVILVDTPGLFDARPGFERAMLGSAEERIASADGVLLLHDATRAVEETIALAKIVHGVRQLIIGINKIDKLSKTALLPQIASLAETFQGAEIFPIAALTGEGVQDLASYLAGLVPLSPWLYPADQAAAMAEQWLAAEITREVIFNELAKELPYHSVVVPKAWERFKNGALKITQSIYVKRASQKAIVIGAGGSMIKTIGAAARTQLTSVLGTPVHLFLEVDVKANWTEDRAIRQLVGLSGAAE